MTGILRAATAADQRVIRQMVAAAHLNPLRLAWSNFLIVEELRAGSLQVVGIGQLRPHSDGTVELASLVVVPEARGRGIGGSLVKALVARADRPLYLMCDGAKVPYYQRFGFAEVTRRADMPRSLRGVHALGAILAAFVRLFWPGGPRLAIMAYHRQPNP